MASLPKIPTEIGPLSNLVDLHLEEVDQTVTDSAAEVGFDFFDPGSRALVMNQDRRLYWVVVDKPAGIFSPDDVFVKKVSPAQAYLLAMGFTLSLYSEAIGTTANQPKFCLVEGRVGPKRANKVPDLNFGPGNMLVPTTDFVAEIKGQNISGFTDSVVCYLGKYTSAEKQTEYRKIINAKSDADAENLDSIRIWNMLTLPDKIQKELLDKGLVETPFSVDDLPLPEELLPTPPPDWMANHVCRAALTGFSSFDNNDENLSESSVAKRKEAGGGEDLCVQQKKPRHGGVVGIDEDMALARNKAPMEPPEVCSASA